MQQENKANSKMAVVTTQLLRASILPDAEEFAKYDSVCPGAADRILKMAESQTEHRQRMENKDIDALNRDSRLGLIFAFIFAMVTLIAAVLLILYDHEVTGTILSGVGLATVVQAFIKGKD
ncbi:MAG: DUF2335 domain-containing protein [Selenomonas bovis]